MSGINASTLSTQLAECDTLVRQALANGNIDKVMKTNKDKMVSVIM